MQIAKNRTMATLIALFLMLTIASTLIALPTANAQVPAGMRWDFPGASTVTPSATRLLLWTRWKDQIPTWVYVIPSPNPVGVGQQITLVMFNPQQPNGASATNDVRYQYSITIKKPDGNTETLPATGTFTSDSTGSAYTTYIPTQVGNYTVTVKFHELFYRWYYDAAMTAAQNTTLRDYYGVTFLESTYTITLAVQQEPVIPHGWSDTPLPTEYWSRPIEGMNTDWYQVSSNWLGNAKDRDYGGSQNRFQTDGKAPNTGHILWTKPTEDGGVVGGEGFSVPGEVFNAGHQYQTRFTQQIIMHGRLYYQGPRYWAGGGEMYTCVDLRTGATIWEVNTTGIGVPSFGYYYDWDDMNQHGIVNPGWLFTANFARAYHPRYGEVTTLNITNVPTGFEVVAPQGEVLRYTIANIGNTTHPNWRLTQWNSSKVFTSASTGAINASLATRFDWNVSIPTHFATAPTIRAVQFNDILLGSNGSHPTGTSAPTYHYPESVTFWALSLKPGREGQLLWMETIPTVLLPNNVLQIYARAAEGVFTFVQLPMQKWVGYSMYTGKWMWETGPQTEYNPLGYYTWPSLIQVSGHHIAYGKLFTAGYTGMVFCYDLKDGSLLWRHEAPTGMEKFKYYPLFLGAIADGKIFVGTHEHSADTPLFKGAKIRCLDVNTGNEVWSMFSWVYPQAMAIADGTLIYWNNYDHQIYAVGKGPSQTTVEAPMAGVVVGNSIIIRGRVTDISPGTQQHEQSKRFPNGVPAVSDESMSKWMEYVYMQKAFPKDCTGVKVTIDVLDSNGNYRTIGTATSDASGSYSFAWSPDIPGKFTVVATFAGSESYYGSYAETAFVADSALAPPAEPEPEPPSMTDTYILYSAIAIIAAIAVVGLLLALLVKKRL